MRLKLYRAWFTKITHGGSHLRYDTNSIAAFLQVCLKILDPHLRNTWSTSIEADMKDIKGIEGPILKVLRST